MFEDEEYFKHFIQFTGCENEKDNQSAITRKTMRISKANTQGFYYYTSLEQYWTIYISQNLYILYVIYF